MTYRLKHSYLTDPPPGYIPAPVAAKHYHFARSTLVRRVREGSLSRAAVYNPAIHKHPTVYYSEHDLRRLYLSRRANTLGGWSQRYRNLPRPLSAANARARITAAH